MNKYQDYGSLFKPHKFPVPLIGVDEVGRGALAGSVVAAAVIFKEDVRVSGIDDSKSMSPKNRELLYERLKTETFWSIGRASPKEIDETNILKATFLAMIRAVNGLDIVPGYILVDGNKLPNWNYPSQAIIRGDSIVPEISAASIIAKVTRDREFQKLDSVYRGYGFSQNKGYPTKQHLSALKSLGLTDLHRKSFRPVRNILKLASG